MNPLYTFITHYDGNESADQIMAPSLESAIRTWQNREFIQQITQPVKEEFKEEMGWLFEEKDYTALDESINIWYFTLLLSDELMRVHIIKTDIGQEVEKEVEMPGVAGTGQGQKHEDK
jgi:hypothetical protein